jgi:molecular chaperone GrpE
MTGRFHAAASANGLNEEGLMTEKRYIPINGRAGFAPSASAGGKSSGNGPAGAAGTGKATSGAPASGGTTSVGTARGASGQAAHGSAKAIDELTKERDALATERDAVAKERDELADSLLRLRAEFENFRRRTSREVLDAETRAQGQMLSDILPVLDNLDRALDAAEHHEEGKVLEGVRMTRNMFAALLAHAGVEEIGQVGGLFDPNLHEAVLVQASDQPEGSVAAVLQRGYRQGDRILRPARVAVSTGRTGAGGSGGAARTA